MNIAYYVGTEGFKADFQDQVILHVGHVLGIRRNINFLES